MTLPRPYTVVDEVCAIAARSEDWGPSDAAIIADRERVREALLEAISGLRCFNHCDQTPAARTLIRDLDLTGK
jgi:hypothetical protein